MPSSANKIAVTTGAIFSSYEVSRINTIQRFIAMTSDREIAQDAAKLGYDTEEHEKGWKDWGIAAGMHVPFHHHLSSAQVALSSVEGTSLRAMIHDIDQFENRWFPRARTAIRRFVAASDREAYETAFFQDMPQQPEGPGVITSVEKFLGRYDGMGTSTVVGVKDAHASLAKRGLTEGTVTKMKELVVEAKKLQGPLPMPEIDGKAIADAATQRREAYDRVNRWYNDWAETFRSEFSYRQLVRLGLVTVRTTKKIEEDVEEPVPPVNF